MKCESCGKEAIRTEARLHQSYGDMPALRWECPTAENMDGKSHWVRWERVQAKEPK